MTGSARTRVVLGLLGAMVLLPFFCFGPPVYFAKATYGRVVEAGSGEPIEGAVVVAAWLTRGLSVDTVSGPTLHVDETVTDEEGAFLIPGWGPKFRSPLIQIQHGDPRITIFKTGYVPEQLFNLELRHWPIRSSEWSGKTIELERFEGTARERYSQIWQIPSSATGSWPATSAPKLLDELLRDETMFKNWAPGDRLFFTNLREIIRARR